MSLGEKEKVAGGQDMQEQGLSCTSPMLQLRTVMGTSFGGTCTEQEEDLNELRRRRRRKTRRRERKEKISLPSIWAAHINEDMVLQSSEGCSKAFDTVHLQQTSITNSRQASTQH